MILLEKWKILTPLQKLPKNVGDLGKMIVAPGFEKLPKVQKITWSGHTTPCSSQCLIIIFKEIISNLNKEIAQ